jgi:hypothetical protein
MPADQQLTRAGVLPAPAADTAVCWGLLLTMGSSCQVRQATLREGGFTRAAAPGEGAFAAARAVRTSPVASRVGPLTVTARSPRKRFDGFEES